jgi:hypothetical protein
MPQCLNSIFSRVVLKGILPVKEYDLIDGVGKSEKKAILTRYKYLIRDGKVKRVIIHGEPWYIPVTEAQA